MWEVKETLMSWGKVRQKFSGWEEANPASLNHWSWGLTAPMPPTDGRQSCRCPNHARTRPSGRTNGRFKIPYTLVPYESLPMPRAFANPGWQHLKASWGHTLGSWREQASPCPLKPHLEHTSPARSRCNAQVLTCRANLRFLSYP